MQKHQTSTRHSPSAVLGVQPALQVLTHNPLVLCSSAVLQGQKSVAIAHQGELYRLQVTKLGKLILTK